MVKMKMVNSEVTVVAMTNCPASLASPPICWAMVKLDTAVGAALFGVGWGLCGVCPGPAIAGLGLGNWSLLWALGGIALGALLQGLRARA